MNFRRSLYQLRQGNSIMNFGTGRYSSPGKMWNLQDGSEIEENADSHITNDTDSSVSDDSSDEFSDDTSVLDAEELDRRCNECLGNLTDLEKQFEVLKEQLCEERITDIDKKISEIQGEKCEEYIVPLEKLRENMEIKIEVAGKLREYKFKNIEYKFLAEDQAAAQNVENEKQLLYDAMYEDIQIKIRKLEEDKNKVDIHEGLWMDSAKKKSKNKSRESKPVIVNGPFIVYGLKREEILEDLATIRASLNINIDDNS